MTSRRSARSRTPQHPTENDSRYCLKVSRWDPDDELDEVPPPGPSIHRRARSYWWLILAIAATAAAVWAASEAQRSAADRAFNEAAATTGLLTAMLDQETGARGFLLSGRESFLTPYVRGQRELRRAVLRSRPLADQADERAQLRDEVATAGAWRREMDLAIARSRTLGIRHDSTRELLERKRLFDRFRHLNAAHQRGVNHERDGLLLRAGLISAGMVALVSALLAGLGALLMRRQSRDQRRRMEVDRSYRESQAEFTETMQLMRDESEANELVQRHLERTIPHAKALVLTRNNSDDRLEAVIDSDTDPALAAKLEDATPDSCLALRLAREHRSGPNADTLLSCDLCGATGDSTLCVPSLVGGEVIGAVLVRSSDELNPGELERVEQSVTQAAPVLANLRNLAMAETRAATDQLTGLPNRRSASDSLKRLAAQAGRAATPLAALLLDLDYFKQINDRFGHAAGDKVLAAVGDVLLHGVRASDFVGRNGGEEFLALLPDTGLEGAAEVAESLRKRIEQIRVPEVERAITTSVGVAVLPDHASDAEGLLRMADRALYAAKGAGRNRTMVADARLKDPEPVA
jgi:diguanylate cyclase (GGDEF)-like protein